MFTLITLPYTLDSLAPVISRQTLEFHYGKHLQAYVDNLNKLIAGTELEGKSLEEIISKASGAVFNNAGQVLNHEMYFTQFTAAPSLPASSPSLPAPTSASLPAPTASLPAPTGNLLSQIEKQWGSFDAFKSDFESKGTTLFGSGWVWLQANAEGELSIAQYANADNPVAHGFKPLLTFDVWEHAYYLDYQNRRAAHLHELWKIVDWKVVEGRY
jgi:Fe-Mn family superoxide dismutase